jgi:hypothetical protein
MLRSDTLPKSIGSLARLCVAGGLLLSIGVSGLTGCAAVGRDANGLADRIIGVNKEIQQRTYERIEKARDVAIKKGDDVSERMAILLLGVCALAYPIGKIGWLATAKAGGLARSVLGGIRIPPAT